MPSSQKRIITFFASPKVTVTCLLLMIVLIVWGTLYQASDGILAARNRFFQSWFFLTSLHVPLPGLKFISLVLTLNMLTASVRFFKKPIKNSGLLLIHLGVILLLTGMLFSSQFTREYFISLQQGETASHAYSTELSEIAIYKKAKSHENALYTSDSVPVNDIKVGQHVSFTNSNIKFIVKDVRKKSSTGGQKDIMVTIMPDAGCSVSKDKEIVLNNNNRPRRVICNEQEVYVSLRPVSIPLPVSLHVLRFSTQFHPGTDMLKEVKCEMAVNDGKLNRKTEIAMNKPFRYGSYTFYQASYSKGTRPITSLSVVFNPHRLFPYIASILLMSGFIVHFLIMVTKKIIETGPKNKNDI